MSWPLPDKFPAGAALRDLVTCEIMETICGILNSVTVEFADGLEYPVIEKTAQPGHLSPWRILIPYPNLTAGITGETNVTVVLNVEWTGTVLRKQTQALTFTNGVLTAVGTASWTTIDTPVAY